MGHLGNLAVRCAFDLNPRPDCGLRRSTTPSQQLGAVALLLQRLSQLRRRALGSLLELRELRRLVTRLARQRHLRLGVPPRPHQLVGQRLDPFALCLQRLSQPGGRALGSLLHLRGLVARSARQRQLGLEVPSRLSKLAG